jgi:hypothetical protein
MRDVMNSPIFLRLGRRLRAPAGTPVGALRRVNISNVVAYNADSRYASIIAGIPEHDIQDITLSNIRLIYRGGGKKELASVQVPERETNYPEPSMFGELPVYGFFVRHASGVNFNNVRVSYLTEDLRPAFYLDNVLHANLNYVTAQRAANVSVLVLTNVADLTTYECDGAPNTHFDHVDQKRF